MQETLVGFLGGENPLEEDRANHSGILAWRICMDRGAWWAAVHGVTELYMTERLSTAQCKFNNSSPYQWVTSVELFTYCCNKAREIPLYHEKANIFPFTTESPKFVPLPVFPFSLNASVCQRSKLKDLFLTPSLFHFPHLVYHQVLLSFPSYQYRFSLPTPLCLLLPLGQLQ